MSTMPGTVPVSSRTVAAALTAIKLLLIPSYHSTDLDVHRNWMAVTETFHLRQWYIDSTSQWTLDYPPFFAWFELVLAQFARLVDPLMLTVQADPYNTPSTKLFMRLSVIISDLVLLAAVLCFCRGNKNPSHTVKAVLLSFGCVALLMVDHIHFQYNGVLLGVLLSALAAQIHGHVLLGGLLFAVLLNLKHLYLILAPVQFVYILRGWVWGKAWLQRLVGMGTVVVLVFAVSIGPIIATGQVLPMLQRLFPFQRGLLHAYWAPNAWALYAAADKILEFTLKPARGLEQPGSNTSSGLVQETVFRVLPQVSARVAAIATLVAMAPCLVSLWRRPAKDRLVRACAYAALCGFMFGFHVHEKASLTFVVLLGLEAFANATRSREFVVVSTAATYSMMPLLYRQEEYATKTLLLALHVCCVWLTLGGNLGDTFISTTHSSAVGTARKRAKVMQYPFVGSWELIPVLFTAGLVPVEAYCGFAHGRIFGERMSFLPLLLNSVYCSAAMLFVWFGMAVEYTFGK